MLNDITIVECEVMFHLVRLRGKDTVQCAHCALHCIALHCIAINITNLLPQLYTVGINDEVFDKHGQLLVLEMFSTSLLLPFIVMHLVKEG